MPSKNLTFRVKEKDQVIIKRLLKLNKKNFFPVNIDNRTALLTLLIETAGQNLLDAAQEGRTFNQEMNNRFYLTKQDLDSIHLIYDNTKQILAVLSILMNNTVKDDLEQQQLDVSPIDTTNSHNKLLRKIINYLNKKDSEQNE